MPNTSTQAELAFNSGWHFPVYTKPKKRSICAQPTFGLGQLNPPNTFLSLVLGFELCSKTLKRLVKLPQAMLMDIYCVVTIIFMHCPFIEAFKYKFKYYRANSEWTFDERRTQLFAYFLVVIFYSRRFTKSRHDSFTLS